MVNATPDCVNTKYTEWNLPPLEKEIITKFTESQNEQFNIPTEGSEIVEFFKGKCVFITGATGFLGKLLVEKLLRTCKDIKAVYIFVREKKGKDINTRICELYEDIIFSKLAKQQPEFRSKIFGIKGEVGSLGLGISPEDRKILKEKISVIFHVAATVKFDEHIRKAVHINVRGTKEIINLAKECPNLESFVHVSTAYAFCVNKEIREVICDPPFDTDTIISIVDKNPENTLTNITPDLVGKFPNTYAFTKAIAEETIQKYGHGLPICIYRPSIVVATYREPLRSWIDNYYGFTGVAAGGGIGLLRTLHCDPNVKADIVPVDLTICGMIAAALKNHTKRTTDIPVYNFVSSVENPITWGAMEKWNAHYGCCLPSILSIWYYSFTLNKNFYVHWLHVIFLHYTIALIYDTAAVVAGKKPQLWKAYKKIHKFSKIISFFCTNEWKFCNDNVQKLWAETSDVDRKLFPFSIKEMDWNDYCETHMLGVRLFVLKDDISTVPAAKKLFFRLKIVHYAVKYIVIFFVLLAIYRVLSSILSSTVFVNLSV